MPFNLLVTYNRLLDIGSFNPSQRLASLKGVFNRDITNNPNFCFRNKKINPTPKDGQIPMETLFTHLTTTIVDRGTNKRAFDLHRSIRLHWVKYHIDEKQKEGMRLFSCRDKAGNRTYIHDRNESYVIVLEPLRKKDEYYLLSAYYLMGGDNSKLENKYKRRLNELL